MTLHQRFQYGERVELFTPRKDKTTGVLYVRENDVQRVFPGANLFKVNGVVLYYLEDENEEEYDPKRIAYYPDNTIDIFITAPAHTSMGSGASLPRSTSIHTNSGKQCEPSSTKELDLNLSTPSLHINRRSYGDALDHGTQLQQQFERSTDQQPVHRQQQMQKLIDMVAQQNEMVVKMNEVLREQEASKEREEQMLKMQQETIDRLIVNQQRVDEFLVQSYELHEYPIPRLFVVLPDSSGGEPRKFLMEGFRLFFLCECGNYCGLSTDQVLSSEKFGTANAASTSPIPVRNSIHIAKQQGYELSRPAEFFDQYGPYVLCMLRILQHCLAVAAVAAPVAVLADSGHKDVMDGVKSISESTINAVDMSINILETKLGDVEVANRLKRTALNAQEHNTIFENLTALEGSDLRRLDTFLRNNDNDKILGNLYRIPTEQEHIKWVCFEHYQEKYRATALSSFVQSVESTGGSYDSHLGRVTIKLKSGTTAKEFFRRLATRTPAVQSLDVTLDWDFGSADLVTLVDMVSKSNVKAVKLDLQDNRTSNATITSLQPGKGRYHSLLGLLSNTKLRSLWLSNLYLLGTRMTYLPSSFNASWLQSFSFYGWINEEDKNRLTNIISQCSQLVDLRLVSKDSGYVYDPRPMKEIVYCTTLGDARFLSKTIRKSGAVLEVLVLRSNSVMGVDIGPEDSSAIPLLRRQEGAPVKPISNVLHLSALTHLDLSMAFMYPSDPHLSTVLPRLDLVHFGFNPYSRELLQHCNIASPKSLAIKDASAIDLKVLLDMMDDKTPAQTWDRLEQLYIEEISSYTKLPTLFLRSTQLTRLSLGAVFDSIPLTTVLKAVNLSRLQEISICNSWHYPSAEQAIASRINDFTESLVVRLDKRSSTRYIQQGGKTRTVVGSSETLPRHRVTNMGLVDSDDHHYRFLQHVLPVYSS
ncbi:hypothetical protein BKA57DRAFT_530420 [Linnemannia elongata]|nr:hypothetical protein BKA57DRAFT_530420 [Linnemannia elongata]